MKRFMIILGVFIGIFILFEIYILISRNTIESYPYKVMEKYDNFEIRTYEASLFTSVKLPMKDYKRASSSGFRQLAGYIFGGNETNKKIAMTSPVVMSIDDSTEMMFMVPKKLKKEKLPKPNQNSIVFKEMPEKKMAAFRFGGWASDEKIERYKKRLTAALDAKGIKHTGRFCYFGYNPPFDILFRKNEVVVELD
ncbi:MAG: heme-binding protein [Crocinitomicaceae bacterium]|jgi:hypothetical protein|nr:heme-binding protein [Crocinitomicaceae bacterium]MDG2465050.1 heme-binding protein [Crocinitomicaceae bacterium]